MKIRKAKIADVKQLAVVHYQSWIETYTDLLGKQALKHLSLESSEKRWTALLSELQENRGAFVSLVDDQVVGVCSWKRREEEIEIAAIYVLAKHQGKGHGKALFKEVEKLINEEELVVRVLEGNPSIAFYEKMGLRVVSKEERKIGEKIVCILVMKKSA